MSGLFLFCKKIKESYWYILLCVFLISLDLVSKKFVKDIFSTGDDSFELFFFLDIVNVKNTGIAFGIFNQNILLSKLVLVVNFFILLYVFRFMILLDDFSNRIGFCLIFSGGFANFVEKIIYGYVFDFIDFHFFDYHWYVFNVADSLICIGSLLLFLIELDKGLKKN